MQFIDVVRGYQEIAAKEPSNDELQSVIKKQMEKNGFTWVPSRQSFVNTKTRSEVQIDSSNPDFIFLKSKFAGKSHLVQFNIPRRVRTGGSSFLVRIKRAVDSMASEGEYNIKRVMEQKEKTVPTKPTAKKTLKTPAKKTTNKTPIKKSTTPKSTAKQPSPGTSRDRVFAQHGFRYSNEFDAFVIGSGANIRAKVVNMSSGKANITVGYRTKAGWKEVKFDVKSGDALNTRLTSLLPKLKKLYTPNGRLK